MTVYCHPEFHLRLVILQISLAQDFLLEYIELYKSLPCVHNIKINCSNTILNEAYTKLVIKLQQVDAMAAKDIAAKILITCKVNKEKLSVDIHKTWISWGYL